MPSTRIALLAALLLAAAPAPAARAERQTLRIEFANDLFFHSDSGISSTQSLQFHSAAAGDWRNLAGVPRFQRRLGRLLLPHTAGLVCRSGLALGQVMQTPGDLTRSDLIAGDVPYAGVLTLRMNWYAYNDREFRGIEAVAGVAGPLSLAAAGQKAIHRLFHLVRPQGWGNQLANEPLLGLNLMRKRKVWRAGRAGGLAADLALSGDAALGNLFTHATAALELRAGSNLPGGFAAIPDPVGFSLHHRAVLSPARPRRLTLQWLLALRGTALARTLLLDGNTFAGSHRVARHAFFAQLLAGLVFELGPCGLGFWVTSTTPIVKTAAAPAAEARERFVTIHLEWRI